MSEVTNTNYMFDAVSEVTLEDLATADAIREEIKDLTKSRKDSDESCRHVTFQIAQAKRDLADALPALSAEDLEYILSCERNGVEPDIKVSTFDEGGKASADASADFRAMKSQLRQIEQAKQTFKKRLATEDGQEIAWAAADRFKEGGAKVVKFRGKTTKKGHRLDLTLALESGEDTSSRQSLASFHQMLKA